MHSCSNPSLSVVIPALNEGEYLRRTVDNLRDTLPPASEIIVVDDGSTDSCADSLAGDNLRVIRSPRLGSSCARNLGGFAATGDILVFCDAHILAPEHWWEPLAEALDQPSVAAVSPVISVMGSEGNKGSGMRWKGPDFGVEWLTPQVRHPHPVGLAPGAFLAMRSEVFQETGGFDEGMILWGMEDSELSLRFWLLGYELRVVASVEVAHLFRPIHPYAVGWTCVIHNMLRVAFSHFKTERVERVIESLKRYRDFSRAMSLLANSDVWDRRSFLRVRRTHDDDWFFQRFPMNI